MKLFTSTTQRSRRDDFFVCPENCSGQTKSFSLEYMALAEGLRGHGESVSPPYTSRDLRPIVHENISLSELRVSNESC